MLAFERRLGELTKSLGSAGSCGPMAFIPADAGPARVLALFADLAVRLESAAGTDVTPPAMIGQFVDGCGQIAVPFEEETVGRECLEAAQQICSAAWDGQPYDVAVAVRRLQATSHEVCVGPSTRSIVQAARDRGIPIRRLNDGGLVQFGYGVRQRRICCAETDQTSAAGGGHRAGQTTDSRAVEGDRGSCPDRSNRWTAPRTPGRRPPNWVCPWWSSRGTAIRDAAWRPT